MLVALGLVGYCLGGLAISGSQRMAIIRNRIMPGVGVTQVEEFLGKPSKIFHHGEPFDVATRSFRLPEIDPQTAVYFYSKDGVPYFNVFVFVNEPTLRVSRVEVENLWW